MKDASFSFFIPSRKMACCLSSYVSVTISAMNAPVCAAFAPGVLVSGRMVSATSSSNAMSWAVNAQIGAFTAQDIALLDEVADTILPETKTPGAKAAHTGAFMAVMVTDTYDDGQQAIFRDGMRKLSDAAFMAATPAQRLAQLEQL